MDWLIKVRAGDFGAIPTKVTFMEASELALSIDGHAVAGGVARVQAITNRVVEEIRREGRTCASPLDLWIALFGQQRGHCHAGLGSTVEDEQRFGELVRVLRAALIALTPKQKAGIMSVLGRYKPLG